MTIEEAQKICGRSPVWAIKNMVKALRMARWLNTKEDEQRLAAGLLILEMRKGKKPCSC
jgi:hypothetical protein